MPISINLKVMVREFKRLRLLATPYISRYRGCVFGQFQFLRDLTVSHIVIFVPWRWMAILSHTRSVAVEPVDIVRPTPLTRGRRPEWNSRSVLVVRNWVWSSVSVQVRSSVFAPHPCGSIGLPLSQPYHRCHFATPACSIAFLPPVRLLKSLRIFSPLKQV